MAPAECEVKRSLSRQWALTACLAEMGSGSGASWEATIASRHRLSYLSRTASSLSEWKELGAPPASGACLPSFFQASRSQARDFRVCPSLPFPKKKKKKKKDTKIDTSGISIFRMKKYKTFNFYLTFISFRVSNAFHAPTTSCLFRKNSTGQGT